MSQRAVPDHVPNELIFDFDYIDSTNNVSDPYTNLFRLDDRGAPDIFYSPQLGGHWVVRRYQHVFDVYRDHERFTTYPVVIPAMQAQTEKMIPFHVDPPDHQRYRQLLGPLFTPAAVKRMEGIVRAIAIELIEPIVNKGEADFAEEFAHKFPALMFLRSMGIPTDHLSEIVKWVSDSLVGSAEEQVAAGAKMTGFIHKFVDQKYKSPGDDWTSSLIASRTTDGSSLSREEIEKLVFFLWLGGLDTVLNSLSHAWRYLAAHPEEQRRLVANPAAIPSAVEEMLRFNAIFNGSRRARHDMDFYGIKMKKGDPVLLLAAVANRDESKFEGGSKVDLERELSSSPHLTFGAGIHRCIGSNLARTELRIAMEEWLKRIPSFRIRRDADIRTIGGVSMGLRSLPLVWDKLA